jgi:hypothetical protein
LTDDKTALSGTVSVSHNCRGFILMRNIADESNLSTSGQHAHDLVLNVSSTCLESFIDSTKWPHTQAIAVWDCLPRDTAVENRCSRRQV